MGFGTNRVVGKQLNKTTLNSNQIKGMNMLKSICDVKKQTNSVISTEEKKEEKEKKPNRMKNLMEMDVLEERRTDNLPSSNEVEMQDAKNE